MVHRYAFYFCWIIAVVFAAGCAPAIPKETRSLVTFYGSFPELQQAPGDYVGEVAMYGGEIIKTAPGESSSEIIVLQLPLNDDGRPQRDKGSQGRFLVRANRFLDPAVYKENALLTVVGRIKGSEVRPIGSYDYRYPVLEALYLKLWPEEGQGAPPAIHFGIGIGTSF